MIVKLIVLAFLQLFAEQSLEELILNKIIKDFGQKLMAQNR